MGKAARTRDGHMLERGGVYYDKETRVHYWGKNHTGRGGFVFFYPKNDCRVLTMDYIANNITINKKQAI